MKSMCHYYYRDDFNPRRDEDRSLIMLFLYCNHEHLAALFLRSQERVHVFFRKVSSQGMTLRHEFISCLIYRINKRGPRD